MLQTYADNRRTQGVNIRRYFAKLLVALSAYSLIEDQLRSGNLYNVSTSALQERLNALLAAHREWGAIFREFGLNAVVPGGGVVLLLLVLLLLLVAPSVAPPPMAVPVPSVDLISTMAAMMMMMMMMVMVVMMGGDPILLSTGRPMHLLSTGRPT